MSRFLFYFGFVLMMGTALASPSRSQPVLELLPAFSDSAVLKRNFSCYIGPFASYDSWLEGFQRRSNFDHERFRERFPNDVIERRQATIDCRIFVYESDGILVEGVMLRPKTRPDRNTKLPVVIYNRGGNALRGPLLYGSIHQSMMPLAELGYVVIASQYRGATVWPTGVERRPELDEFGGDEVNDVKNLLPVIDGMPDADSTRLAMVGSSRGGMMSYLAAPDIPNLRALVVRAGVVDLHAGLSKRPEMEEIYRKFIPNYATEKSTQLEARSVLYRLDKLPPDLPVLLLHGEKDMRVDVSQSRRMAMALAAEGRPHKLVVYPIADHALHPNQAEADDQTAAWLTEYL